MPKTELLSYSSKELLPFCLEKRPLTLEDLKGKSKKVLDTYGFAQYIHRNQKRFSGEPYIRHLEETTNIILSWLKPCEITPNLEDLTCASLLHDTVEDQNVNIETIRQVFGDKVAELVYGVTLFRSEKPQKEKDRENLRHIAQEGYLNPEVFILKLADRLHNMRTLDFVPDPQKRRLKAQETFVYARLAESIGIWEVKRELEDLSFRYSQPENYERIKKEIEEDHRTSPIFIQGMIETLTNIFSSNGGNPRIEARRNGLYALYQKRERLAELGKGPRNTFSHINDVVSFRVIIPNGNLPELYRLMGAIHTHPIFLGRVDADRLDDFVNSPKDNKYSALQTTLNLEVGSVEIAFVTEEMEEFNNLGIISNLRRNRDLSGYRRNIVFDEDGEAWFLPLSATYIDFVYEKGVGAKAKFVVVDGKNKPLTDPVENASLIKIVLSDKPAPDPAYLAHCNEKTKAKILAELDFLAWENLIEKGKMMLEKALIPRGLLSPEDLSKVRNTLIASFRCTLDEFYYRIGNGNLELSKVNMVLDQAGITKDALGLTTIRISGRNEVGILRDVSNLISSRGGDILNFKQTEIRSPSDTFTIRLTIRKLNSKQEEEIKEALEKDHRFTEVTVV